MKACLLAFSFILSSTMSLSLEANVQKAPPAIALNRQGGEKLVFVDFERADYHIVYDTARSQAQVESVIRFQMPENGLPVFDLVAAPSALDLDGQVVSSNTHQISAVTTLRYITTAINAGTHELRVRHELTENTIFNGAQVRSGFWTSDLSDREFLEQYLPSNLEYDQYSMRFHVSVTGTNTEHEIFSNGLETSEGHNSWQIEFPSHFNASSVYFHLMPLNAFRRVSFDFSSIDGRKLPVVIYSTQSLEAFRERAVATLQELERDYGPFPHQKVVIYGAGSGGMEYCGATITSLSALSHELTHSYFARGLMPANGNAGWIDEAIASWRDGGYRQSSRTSLMPAKMAGHSVYTRSTDRDAYGKGARFMGFLDATFAAKGGLKKFLRDFFERRHFNPFFNQEFKSDLELYFNHNLDAEFDRYVLGKTQVQEHESKHDHQARANPFHPVLSKNQLRDLL